MKACERRGEVRERRGDEVEARDEIERADRRSAQGADRDVRLGERSWQEPDAVSSGRLACDRPGDVGKGERNTTPCPKPASSTY